ncbi:MAG: helix-turn-helix domain-containing protein [Pseudomonadota bacterium]
MGTDLPGYVRWTSHIAMPQPFLVLPDGCRDILVHKTGTGTSITLTERDLRPRRIMLQPGDEMTGYRLRPGLHVDIRALTATDIPEAIAHANHQKSDLSEAIALLGATSAPVVHIARQLGVSLRSLQRHLAKQALPAPDFWRCLGRARRAAIALGSDLSLTDVAGLHGYSDQSHMTRACRHWFGYTPQQIRTQATILDDINQPGLGTWGQPSAN